MSSKEELIPAESAATARGFYTWTFPGAPVRVHLQLSVVESLGREVLRAFESVPSHSVEIGGVLLGTADFAASPIVEVKDFEPFLCEYRPDHKFILSDADRRKLEKLLAARKERQEAVAVVGFYRSHLGEGLRLSPEDLSIAQACFCDPADVFLVVKPAADRSMSAGFFFWDNGRIDSEFTFLEFPFDTRLLSTARVKPTRAALAQQPAEPETGSLTSEIMAPAPEDAEPRSSSRLRRLWYPLLALLMIALGAIGYEGYLKWSALQPTASASAASDSPGLALQVERRGADLRVSWNRNAPLVTNAREGVLSIRDGEAQQQTLHLDLDQLRNGSVLYTPANTNVQFRLEVTAPDNSKLSESVLALTAAQPGSLGAKAPAVKSPARPAPSGANPPPTSATGDRKLFTPPGPSRALGDPARLLIVDPPAQSRGATPQNPPAVQQPNLAPPPAAERQRTEQAPVAPVYTPPRPIRRPQPLLSPAVANLVAAPVDVDVRVQIDKTGRVVNAEPLPAKEPVSSSLVGAARNAALLWRFEPARQGTQPVPSVLILRFQYRPASAP